MPSVEVIGGIGMGPRPTGGRWREVAIHENAGAGIGLDLQAGDKVRHPKWGEGTVVVGSRSGRRRAAHHQLPERRSEDGDAQIRAVGTRLVRNVV